MSMRNIQNQAVVVLAVAATNAYLLSSQALASNSDISAGAGKVATNDQVGQSVSSGLLSVTNVLLFLLGAVSVIMIVVGGIRFATSNGNADQVKQAKNILLYAVIGLVVAIMAYAIVDFVVDAF